MQDIIVYIVVIAVVAWSIRRIIRLNKKGNACNCGCSSNPNCKGCIVKSNEIANK